MSQRCPACGALNPESRSRCVRCDRLFVRTFKRVEAELHTPKPGLKYALEETIDEIIEPDDFDDEGPTLLGALAPSISPNISSRGVYELEHPKFVKRQEEQLRWMLASEPKRIVASLIDLFIPLFLWGLVLQSGLFGKDLKNIWQLDLELLSIAVANGSLLYAFVGLVLLAYLVHMLSLQFFSRTLGNLCLHLKVVDAKTGAEISKQRAQLRILFATLSAVPLGLGLLVMILDPKHRMFHDFLLRTVIVDPSKKTRSFSAGSTLSLLTWACLLFSCGAGPIPHPEPENLESSKSVDVQLKASLPKRYIELEKQFAYALPSMPNVQKKECVDKVEDLLNKIKQPNVHLVVKKTISLTREQQTNGISIGASNVFIEFEGDFKINRLTIQKGVKRIHIRGGQFAEIEILPPAQFVPTVQFRSEWMAEDIVFENVRIDSPDAAFRIRGRRVLILNSKIRAKNYSVWCGDTDNIPNEDILLIGNEMDSSGPEATVRLVSVNRSLLLENKLRNTLKHNYRVHGQSTQNIAESNTLLGTGIMIGGMPQDKVLHAEIRSNTIFQSGQTLLDIFTDGSLGEFMAEKNQAYSNVFDRFYGGPVRKGWVFKSNEVHPYKEPSIRFDTF